MQHFGFWLHFSAVGVYFLGLYGYYTKPMPGRNTYGGNWKFLTFINLCIQTFYFILCVLNNIVGTNCGPNAGSKAKSRLQKCRDLLHSSIAFPMGTFVVLTFWAIYAVDRELVYPTHLDKIIPSWLNHVLHTTVLPILLVEKALVYHQYPSQRVGMGIAAAVSLAYLSWVFWIAYKGGFWVYPVLEVLDWIGRSCFIGILLVFMLSIYSAGNKFTERVWKRTKEIDLDKQD